MRERKGAIAWMAQNPVAANLMMALLIIGGLVLSGQVRQEVFPEFKLDMVSITVPYPGASPAEVEQGIVLAVEEAVRGLDGVKRVTAKASEGSGSVTAELMLGEDTNKVLSDIKNAVDRLTSLPEDAERPTVSLMSNRSEVISVILSGPVTQGMLRTLAERVRDDLLQDPNITHAELFGAPAKEITIEVPKANLQAYDLTLEQVAGTVGQTALELAGGAVKTAGGEVLLRTSERRDEAAEFANIPVLSAETGTRIRLDDIADVRDDFAETDESATFQDLPAVMVKVYRTGDQTPIEVADAVKAHVAELRQELPESVAISTWFDWSLIYRGRIDLMLRNAQLGLILVLVCLGLFLELRLAFWVTMGIPISFLGAVLLMPASDVSINMISLFAFIITLGMVVDDAIVVGENIYELRNKGHSPVKAAIEGVSQVATPVTFSIATTITAFMPMFFVPGFMGKFMRVVPIIVTTVLALSLFESLFILPAHLAHLKEPKEGGWYARIHGAQQRVSRGLERFIQRFYAPLLAATLRRRFLAMCVGLAIMISMVGVVGGGRIGFRFMPAIDGDLVIASVELPFGSPVSSTLRIQKRLLETANEVIEENGGDSLARGVFGQVGQLRPAQPMPGGNSGAGGPHLSNVQVYLQDPEGIPIPVREFVEKWRERIGTIPEAKTFTLTADSGPSAGSPVDVELVHDDPAVLEAAGPMLAAKLRDYAGVYDIEDGVSTGKPQLDLRLRDEGTSLGLTVGDIARQVRSAFYGAEALRQQEGRDEVRVLVRLPRQERESIYDAEELLIRTPEGAEVPLREVAFIDRSRSPPVIERTEGRRVIHVKANVLEDVTTPGVVLDSINTNVLPELQAQFPGLTWTFSGEKREQTDSVEALKSGAVLAAIGIFALLAIPFRSYIQPVIVMAAIPFGIVGAILGHLIMGYNLSMISIMGIIALSGVVVNDSLVLIDAANRNARGGMTPREAIQAAGVRRFRPIMLTSLTTFLGLMPMITETSVQARFLIPMAISLGFGVLFATFIILLLVPALYLTIEGAKGWFQGIDDAVDRPAA